jgi:hypothetical protein
MVDDYEKAENGILGLPADSLILANGKILALRYRARAYDNWDADELLRLASRRGLVATPSAAGI